LQIKNRSRRVEAICRGKTRSNIININNIKNNNNNNNNNSKEKEIGIGKEIVGFLSWYASSQCSQED